eukprot:11157056-Heterocapsa_arctica.AAC.1
MYIRDKERCSERQQINMREQKGSKLTNFEHILYRIGEASKPGPSHKGCHSKQRKLGDFFHQHHINKDDEDMRFGLANRVL